MKVVTLIPWRPDGSHERTWNWDVTRWFLQHQPWKFYTGEPKGEEWSRAEAVNAAAAAAGAWDVAIVGDADTIGDIGDLQRAIAWVKMTGGGARPHTDRWNLDPRGSLRFAQEGYGADLRDSRTPCAGGGLLVITREAFEKVGGYDESFRGWGYEDSAMNCALMRHARFDRLPGQAWHLYHEPNGWKSRSAESVQKHRELMTEYADEIAAWYGNLGLRVKPEQVV